MGRFHRHADGTEHSHEHDEGDHDHDHDHGTVRGVTSGITAATSTPARSASRCSSASSTRTTESPATNRAELHGAGVRTVNLMSSPGAGKTTLLRRTLATLGARVRIGVLEGDIATSLDADQLEGSARRSRSSTRAPASAASATSTP